MSKREIELQKLLTDERIRAEQHKIYYQLLKAEHKRLQDEFGGLQTKLTEIMKERDQQIEEKNLLLKNVERELLEAKTGIEQLQKEILSPHRIESLRKEIEGELEINTSELIRRAEDEAFKCREDYRNLFYRFTVTEAESESAIMTLQRTLNELRVQNETEVSQLKKRSESAETKLQEEEKRNAELKRKCEKENVIMKQQLEAALLELEDGRKKWAQERIQIEEHRRDSNKRLNEMTTLLRTAEMEKSSLKEDLHRLEAALKQSLDENSHQRLDLLEAKASTSQLRLLASDLDQKIKLERVEHQQELQRQKDECKSNCEHMTHLMGELRLELDTAQKQTENEERKIVELNCTLVKETSEIKELNNKILDLEKQLKVKESDTRKKKDKLRFLKRKISDLSLALEKKQSIEERWKTRSMESQQQLEKLKKEVTLLGDVEKQLINRNEELCALLQSAQSKIQRKFVSSEQKSSSRLKQRNNELSKKLKHYKKKFQKYIQLTLKMKHKIDIQKAKLQELTIEKESLKCGVPHEVHEIVKKKLFNLQRRNEDFRRALFLQVGNKAPCKIADKPIEKANNDYVYSSEKCINSEEIDLKRIH